MAVAKPPPKAEVFGKTVSCQVYPAYVQKQIAGFTYDVIGPGGVRIPSKHARAFPVISEGRGEG